ncbi:MAG: DNA methyltransferase [Rudaea sp.]
MNNHSQFDLFGDSSPASLPDSRFERRRAARSGTFTDNMQIPIHRWFRYSAGFSAKWVEELIADYPAGEKPTLLDPFAGSGTALLACERSGITAYGYESHPFVCRIAEAKLLWHLDEAQFLKRALDFLAEAERTSPALDTPHPELLEKCFIPESLTRLLSLRNHYLKAADHTGEWKLIWLAITAILRPCSHVGTAQWQYVLPNERKARSLDPYPAFQAKVREIAADMAHAKRSGFENTAIILRHDARQTAPLGEEAIDFVVTSPPYPNNYDYADATRLEMTFWGEVTGWGDLQSAVRQFIIRSCSQHSAAEKLDLESLLKDSCLAPIHSELVEACNRLSEVRLTKGGKKTYHTMVAAYFSDLSRVFSALRPICRPGSRLCFVIGDAAPYGVHLPVERWLGVLALAAGFRSYAFEKVRDRNIKWKNRKHRVPLHEGRLWIEG